MEGGSEGARGGWGWEGGIEGREGGSKMLGRERASVEEGRSEGGWVNEGTERGMDNARERWERRSERRRDWPKKGGS